MREYEGGSYVRAIGGYLGFSRQGLDGLRSGKGNGTYGAKP